MVATSPDKRPTEERIKVDSRDTVEVMATATRALDLDSPMPLATGTRTRLLTPMRRRTTRLRMTFQWLVGLSLGEVGEGAGSSVAAVIGTGLPDGKTAPFD